MQTNLCGHELDGDFKRNNSFYGNSFILQKKKRKDILSVLNQFPRQVMIINKERPLSEVGQGTDFVALAGDVSTLHLGADGVGHMEEKDPGSSGDTADIHRLLHLSNRDEITNNTCNI